MKNNLKKGFSLSGLMRKEHEGKWVAISADYKKVVGYSDDLKKLAREVGDEKVVYHMGLSSDKNYAFYGVDKI